MSNLVFKRIESLINNFTPSEKKVADYIVENYKVVSTMTIKQLAKHASTSDAAVIRFLKKMEIDSFGTLKMYLYYAKESKENESDSILQKIEKTDSSEEIYKKIATISKKTIDDTLTFLNFNALDQSIDIIKKAKRILICGIGASAVVGSDLHLKFVRINLPVSFFYDVHVQLMTAINLDEDDCVIIISTSGRSREMIEIASIANQNKTPIISVTQFGKSPLSEKSTVNLHVASTETSMRIGTMNARIAELTLIDTLFTYLCIQDSDKYLDYAGKASEVMDQFKY